MICSVAKTWLELAENITFRSLAYREIKSTYDKLSMKTTEPKNLKTINNDILRTYPSIKYF